MINIDTCIDNADGYVATSLTQLPGFRGINIDIGNSFTLTDIVQAPKL